MSEIVAQSLARLASLNLQRRYIVQATRNEYYLPEDLLERAHDLVRQVRERFPICTDVSDATTRAIFALEPLLDAVVPPPDRTGLDHLIEHDPRWRAAREQAARCLDTFDFDLAEFECTETNNRRLLSN